MKHLNLRLALGLFLIGLMACTDMVEVIEQPSSTTKDHFSLEQAIAQFKKVDLSEYLKYELDTLPEGACYPLYPGGFSLIPSKWQYENTLSEERVFVAIRARNYYAARDTMVEKTKGKCTPVCQRLMFVKSSTTGEIRMYIESILSDASYYKNRKRVTGGYINKSRNNFTAIVVVQDMLCRIQRIERYICGTHTETIYSHTDEHNCFATMESTTHKCSHECNHDTIHNPYDFFVHYRWKVSHLSNLRSEDIELEGTYCAFCGQLSGNCTCEASITEDYPDDGGGFGDEGGGDSGDDSGGDVGGSGGGDNTDDNDPCISDDGNLANPLNNMELAPPNPANPAGATQGLTRDNGTLNHSGVDFAGAIGTPIYATHTGTIASEPYEDDQPNRIYNDLTGDYEYPSDYTGDRNDAGNRIYINIGNNRQVTYWHLQAETPIATNPRTGEPFSGEDTIYMGEVVGYIGITGNADPSLPHLHYGIRQNGVWQNPFNYINTTIDSTYQLNTPCNQ